MSIIALFHDISPIDNSLTLFNKKSLVDNILLLYDIFLIESNGSIISEKKMFNGSFKRKETKYMFK